MHFWVHSMLLRPGFRCQAWNSCFSLYPVRNKPLYMYTEVTSGRISSIGQSHSFSAASDILPGHPNVMFRSIPPHCWHSYAGRRPVVPTLTAVPRGHCPYGVSVSFSSQLRRRAPGLRRRLGETVSLPTLPPSSMGSHMRHELVHAVTMASSIRW